MCVLHSLVVRIQVEECARKLLFAVLDRVELVDARPVVRGVPSEGDGEVVEEHVHTRKQGLRRVRHAVHRGGALVHNDAVRQVRRHDEIVLHNERRLLRVHDEPLDGLGCDDALLRVQVGARLVDQVDVGGGAQAQRDGHALQLPARQVLHLLVHERLHLHGLHDVRHKLRVQVGLADLLVQHGAHAHLALRADLLRLVRDVELGDLLPHVVVWRQHAR
mmetsp:Transcript_18269/g.35312  ORF Transcript_18269/g.35312 Transcript_18269/m.35312 type:complete len:219 (+) Transcript_18269:103-759(+)